MQYISWEIAENVEKRPISCSAPKVNSIYSGLRFIHYSSFVEICFVVLWKLADKPTSKHTDTDENITSLVEVIIKE